MAFFLSKYIKRGRTLNCWKVEKEPVRIGTTWAESSKTNYNIQDASFDMYCHVTAC